MGIEPTLSAWEAEVLPLNYTRAKGAADINMTAKNTYILSNRRLLATDGPLGRR